MIYVRAGTRLSSELDTLFTVYSEDGCAFASYTGLCDIPQGSEPVVISVYCLNEEDRPCPVRVALYEEPSYCEVTYISPSLSPELQPSLSTSSYIGIIVGSVLGVGVIVGRPNRPYVGSGGPTPAGG